jgi:uncharacterized Zn finger protein
MRRRMRRRGLVLKLLTALKQVCNHPAQYLGEKDVPLAGRSGRDMPHDLVEAAAAADVPLLPGIGDLQPECDREGWELPCRHAAALCFQAAWLLDADPFVLLLSRGLGEEELTGELRRRAELAATVTWAAERARKMLTESDVTAMFSRLT